MSFVELLRLTGNTVVFSVNTAAFSFEKNHDFGRPVAQEQMKQEDFAKLMAKLEKLENMSANLEVRDLQAVEDRQQVAGVQAEVVKVASLPSMPSAL